MTTETIMKQAVAFYSHVHPRVGEAITASVRSKRSKRYTIWQGALWSVDATGLYERLVARSPDQLQPTEDVHRKDRRDVADYARRYEEGTLFPPLSVLGPDPDHSLHRITDGHRRWLAAQEVDAPLLLAWSDFHYPIFDSHGNVFWQAARLSDRTDGQKLARHLGIEWCPQCGSILNYHGGELCRSCQISRRTLKSGEVWEDRSWQPWDPDNR